MLDPELFGYHSSSQSSSGTTMRDRAARNAAGSGGSTRDVKYLEDRFERLSLVCMAMWSLLQDKTNLTEQDLLKRVEAIDLMDGREDGKAEKVGVVRCGKCDRPMNNRHLRCIYCGAEKQVGSAFDRV